MASRHTLLAALLSLAAVAAAGPLPVPSPEAQDAQGLLATGDVPGLGPVVLHGVGYAGDELRPWVFATSFCGAALGSGTPAWGIQGWQVALWTDACHFYIEPFTPAGHGPGPFEARLWVCPGIFCLRQPGLISGWYG